MFGTTRWWRGLGVAFVLLCLASPAGAEIYKYKAVLAAASDGPTGRAQLTYNSDTRQLEYIVVFDRLSAPATNGHIQSSADGAVVVQFPVVQSPIGGSATLSPAQAALLEAGQLSIDIDTAKYPAGELKGPIGK